MAVVFVSHSTRDTAMAARLRRWLDARGFSSVFIAGDTRHGIAAGRRWEEELYAELRRTDVVVYLGTRAAATSPWCFAEVAMARSLGKDVVPLLLEDGGAHALLTDTQAIAVDTTDGDGFGPLGDALAQLTADPFGGLSWDPELPPYPGLLAFDERRAGVFFGRDEEVTAVVERLTWPHAGGTERLVAVVGASGSGKSSVVLGGVLPRLRRLREGLVLVPAFAPRDDPVGALAAAASAAGLEPDLGGGSAGGGVVVCVDQAEQLVTQCTPRERREFLDALAAALERRPGLRVVATLRSEYLSEIVAGTALEGRSLSTVTIGRLSGGRLVLVIEQPARRAGLEFEPGLVNAMVEDTRSGGQSAGDPLPLLAFTLRRLYDGRADRTLITRDDYLRIGGIVGALRTEADAVFARFQRTGREELAISTLLQLVHVEPEHEAVARSVRRAGFDAARWPVVEAFRDAHLLTTEGDDAVVSVAHEALLRDWPVLARAIERSRDELVERSRLERDAAEWDRAGRDASDLARGRRLKVARAAVGRGRSADPLLADFIVASTRARWRTRALMALGAGLACAAAALAIAFVYERVQERLREERARAALVRLAGGAAVDAHEVTFGQYEECIAAGRCARPPNASSEPNADAAPVVMVDAEQAVTFCRWIGRRLPTRPELVRAAPHVRHLLDSIEGGGQEWTSTTRGAGHFTVAHDRETDTTSVSGVNRNHRDEDLGFRCAES